jgi:hypothetical protein
MRSRQAICRAGVGQVLWSLRIKCNNSGAIHWRYSVHHFRLFTPEGLKMVARGGFPSGGRDWGAKRNPLATIFNPFGVKGDNSIPELCDFVGLAAISCCIIFSKTIQPAHAKSHIAESMRQVENLPHI